MLYMLSIFHKINNFDKDNLKENYILYIIMSNMYTLYENWLG